MRPVIPPSLALDGMAMASPNHDVSRRGGDVGPHRHLEDQTDQLLFFCHLSSRGAKHYSHASRSLRSPCLASAIRPASRVIPVSLLIEHDGLIHFEERPLDHRLGQSVRFNTSSSNPVSISNSANDACRKCWFSLASFWA